MSASHARVQKSNEDLSKDLMNGIEGLAPHNAVAKTVKRGIKKTTSRPMNFLVEEKTFSFLMDQRSFTEKERQKLHGQFYKQSSPSNEAKECVLLLEDIANKAGVQDVRKYLQVLVEADLAKGKQAEASKEEFE